MPDLPPPPAPTIEAIYKHYSNSNGDWRRDHLGASQIGKECLRCLWYDFRWATSPNFSGRMLRLFETGFREESRIIENLRSIGVTVYSEDPEIDKQITYSRFSGHFSGSLDGIAIGFEEAPKTWHVLECKTSNLKSFNHMKKYGVEKSKYVHYCQVQLYMHWSGLERAFYIMVCKDNDEIYTERVYYNADLAKKLEKKASEIIFATEPSFRQGDETTFMCKFCNHKEICHSGKLPEVHCRTCCNITPCEDGTWTCRGEVLNKYRQREGCEKHIFIPALVPLTQIDADPDLGTITYENNIINGPGNIESKKWVL
jgi:hypothetical protein